MSLRRFCQRAALRCQPQFSRSMPRLTNKTLAAAPSFNKASLATSIMNEDAFDWSFDDPFFRQPIRRRVHKREWLPAVDVSESDTDIMITVELPGVKAQDVKVNITKEYVSISGEKKAEEQNHKLHRVERSFGKFSRSWSLPDTIDTEKAEARFKDGIMTVKLPKFTELPRQAKELPIKTD